MSTDRDKAIVLPLRAAATKDHPPAVPSSGVNAPILLPKWVYIKDRNGYYLSVRSSPGYRTLTFRTGSSVPDLDCAFETHSDGTSYTFHGRNGYIMRYYADWYSCDPDPETPGFFQVITSTGNHVYLKDNYAPTRFISDELDDEGAPIPHDYINESSEFEILQAAIKNEVIDVQYDIPGGKVREAPPVIALSTDVFNRSDVDVEQTLTYSYEKWTVGTWNNTAGIEIGVKSTFEAGVPFIASAEFEISVTASYSHEWGGEDGKKEIITTSTTILVPAHKKGRATVIVRNAQLDVGFTYTEKILWSDGESEEATKTGIYHNVDSWHVDVVLENLEDTECWTI